MTGLESTTRISDHRPRRGAPPSGVRPPRWPRDSGCSQCPGSTGLSTRSAAAVTSRLTPTASMAPRAVGGPTVGTPPTPAASPQTSGTSRSPCGAVNPALTGSATKLSSSPARNKRFNPSRSCSHMPICPPVTHCLSSSSSRPSLVVRHRPRLAVPSAIHSTRTDHAAWQAVWAPTNSPGP